MFFFQLGRNLLCAPKSVDWILWFLYKPVLFSLLCLSTPCILVEAPAFVVDTSTSVLFKKRRTPWDATLRSRDEPVDNLAFNYLDALRLAIMSAKIRFSVSAMLAVCMNLV